ncbi:MAG: MFS transporter, partial [Dermatophilaceae bacterium]
GVIVFMSVFALGETLLQATLPAIVDDLTTDREPGRSNALSASAFQLGAITAPIVAGWLLDRGLAGAYIGVLLVCLAVVAGLALALERHITPQVNGVGQP